MLLALAFLIAEPVPADFFRPANPAETGLLVMAGASILVDYLYSTDIKNHSGAYEAWPPTRWITGRRVPTDMQYAGTAVVNLVVTLALWRWWPEVLGGADTRWLVPAGVLGYELANANHFMQENYTLVR